MTDREWEAIKASMNEKSPAEREALIKELASAKTKKKAKKAVKEEGDYKALEEAVIDRAVPISYTDLEKMAEEYGFSPSTQKPGQKGAVLVKKLSYEAAKMVFPMNMVMTALLAQANGKPILPPGFIDAFLEGKIDMFGKKEE